MRDERTSDGDALALSAGELVREAAAESGEPHVSERCGHLVRDLGRRGPRHLEREGDVALDRHVRKQRVALEHGAYGPGLRRPFREVLAVQENAAAIRQVEAGDHAQKRRLAATGRAEQREELAGPNREADAIDSREIAKTARDILNLE